MKFGEHSLKAIYSGNTNYTAGEGTISYNVDKNNQTALVIEEVLAKVFGDEPFVSESQAEAVSLLIPLYRRKCCS